MSSKAGKSIVSVTVAPVSQPQHISATRCSFLHAAQPAAGPKSRCSKRSPCSCADLALASWLLVAAFEHVSLHFHDCCVWRFCSIMDVEVQSFTVKLTTASDALRDEESHWERVYCAADECVFFWLICGIVCVRLWTAWLLLCGR